MHRPNIKCQNHHVINENTVGMVNDIAQKSNYDKIGYQVLESNFGVSDEK